MVLAACQGRSGAVPQIATPHILQIQITPGLRWLGAIFQECAFVQSGVSLVVAERSALAIQLEGIDFAFRWGQPKDIPPFAAVLTQDELAVVVSPKSPVASLAMEDLRNLYSGNVERWDQVKSVAGGTGQVKAYVYASGEDVQELVAEWLQLGKTVILAPGPEEVRQAVGDDPQAIGYLPARWVDKTVKRVNLTGMPVIPPAPLLAMGSLEPQGVARGWLLCVQNRLQ